MSDSISKRLKRDRELNALAADHASLADSLASARAHYGDDWDPDSMLARRLRATIYAEQFLQDLADARAELGDPLPEDLQASYFDVTRDELAEHCGPGWKEFQWAEARKDMKPKAGPQGAAGLIARWSVRTGAFGELGQDWHAAAKRFRTAVSEARRHLKRTREKKITVR